jgi:hypothetical protein
VSSELAGSTRRMIPLLIEAFGNRRRRGTVTAKFGRAVSESLEVAKLFICFGWTAKLVLGLHSACPPDCRVYPFRVVADGNRDAFDQATNDYLPLLIVGAGRVPQARQIGSTCFDSLPLSHGRLSRCIGQESVIFFFQFALFPQCLFPASLQLTPNQAILGFDGVVLSSGALGVDPRSLQPFLPMLI